MLRIIVDGDGGRVVAASATIFGAGNRLGKGDGVIAGPTVVLALPPGSLYISPMGNGSGYPGVTMWRSCGALA